MVLLPSLEEPFEAPLFFKNVLSFFLSLFRHSFTVNQDFFFALSFNHIVFLLDV